MGSGRRGMPLQPFAHEPAAAPPPTRAPPPPPEPAVLVAVGSIVALSFALGIVNTVDKARGAPPRAPTPSRRRSHSPRPSPLPPVAAPLPLATARRGPAHAPRLRQATRARACGATCAPVQTTKRPPHPTAPIPPTHPSQIPIVSDFVELVGIAVTGWFTYRYLTVGPDRRGAAPSEQSAPLLPAFARALVPPQAAACRDGGRRDESCFCPCCPKSRHA
jgi:hypothetical protein